MEMTLACWKRSLAVCLSGLALSLPGLAADLPAPQSGLAAALEQAWRLHPPAAALDARQVAARAAQEIAAGLTPEPGSLSLGNRNDRFNSDRGKQEYELELATPLWLPGQKSAREAEATSLVDEAAAKRAALRWALAGELREIWWSLAAARSARMLAEQRLTTARSLQTDVQRRYKAGELSRIDANLAQMETRTAEAESIEAEATLIQVEQSFRVLTGATAPTVISEEMPAARRSPLAAQDAAQMHPQLVAAAAAARSAQARVKVVDESRRAAPELSLRFVRERDDNITSFDNSVGIRLKIPFSSGPQVRRERSSAQADADQVDAEMQRAQASLQLETERAQRALQAAERQFTMAEERRELSADNLQLSEKSFKLGETDVATLLRIRAAAYDAEAFFARQRVARAAAISRLNQILGVLP
jgi:cobalt-zinc-cadmium efflux system outer membrane protein